MRVGGIGGVEMLDAGSGREGACSGWDLLSRLLSAEWESRPDATAALQHPYWEAAMKL